MILYIGGYIYILFNDISDILMTFKAIILYDISYNPVAPQDVERKEFDSRSRAKRRPRLPSTALSMVP